jgi:hypothetical protein
MNLLLLTRNRIPLLIASVCCIEALIYLWALWTASLDKSNFFAIEPEFVLDKCARNSGRVSAALILMILLMVGYYGLKKIYEDNRRKESFFILMTLFTSNHLIHFLFVFLRIQSHHKELHIGENLHGFITFIFIVATPFILWTFKNLNRALYVGIVLHLFNVSYFMNETFLGKVTPSNAAYHNQFGIVAITAACLYVLYSVFRESKQNVASN